MKEKTINIAWNFVKKKWSKTPICFWQDFISSVTTTKNHKKMEDLKIYRDFLHGTLGHTGERKADWWEHAIVNNDKNRSLCPSWESEANEIFPFMNVFI